VSAFKNIINRLLATAYLLLFIFLILLIFIKLDFSQSFIIKDEIYHYYCLSGCHE